MHSRLIEQAIIFALIATLLAIGALIILSIDKPIATNNSTHVVTMVDQVEEDGSLSNADGYCLDLYKGKGGEPDYRAISCP